jgi:hypothetical protein
MNEIWEVDGKKYKVNKANINRFLQDHPNAVLVTDPTSGEAGDRYFRQNLDFTGSQIGFKQITQEVVTPGTGEVRKPKKYRSYLDEILPGFDKTWLGSSIAAQVGAGESMDLFMEGSSITEKTLRSFIDSQYEVAANYVESERMKTFNEKYEEGGKTWASFFWCRKRGFNYFTRTFCKIFRYTDRYFNRF